MAAYFIAQYQVNDAALYAEYSAGMHQTIQIERMLSLSTGISEGT